MRNRLCSSEELTERLERLQSNTCLTTQEPVFSHDQVCLFGPEKYEAGYSYPLIVWLHSCESGERELENVMPALSLQNYVGCAPRGTNACDSQGVLFRWGQSPASAAISEELVFEAIEQASSSFSVDPNRIFLAGFGGGGSMAWRIALKYPKRFAGVISICGDFPHENQPLANCEHARDLATLWLYGADSEQCGIHQVCDSLPLLHSASLSVDIRQYPCGTELLSNMLSDANSWIMGHVTDTLSEPTTHAEETFSNN